MYSIMNRQAEEDTGLIDAVCISVYVNLNYVDNYFVFDQNKLIALCRPGVDCHGGDLPQV